MQTFLPFADFAETARVLDGRRLGKQRVETLQILRALRVPGYGWRHHPAVGMWAGYEEALARYGLQMCEERRGGSPRVVLITCGGLFDRSSRTTRTTSPSPRSRSNREHSWYCNGTQVGGWS